MSAPQDRGRRGEELVGRYLEADGWTILARNYRSRYGEIDLIVQKEGIIAFVEVKARKADGIALPREYVDVKKQRRLIKTAIQYLSSTGVELQPRFDVFEVKLHSQTGAVIGYKYIENAFEVGDIDAIF